MLPNRKIVAMTKKRNLVFIPRSSNRKCKLETKWKCKTHKEYELESSDYLKNHIEVDLSTRSNQAGHDSHDGLTTNFNWIVRPKNFTSQSYKSFLEIQNYTFSYFFLQIQKFLHIFFEKICEY